MNITVEMVKELRNKTGSGIMDAKRALEEAGGNMSEAAAILQQQGLARAEKKAGRAASQGLVEPYIHGGGRIGTLVEVNCETDFVARTEDFRALAHDIAMQVAAADPKYLTANDIPSDELAAVADELGGKDAATERLALMSQPFIKDPGTTIEALVKDHIARLGENIVVRRFARFELGVDSDAEQDDNDS